MTKVFYIQIWFKCETPLLFFWNKNYGLQKKTLEQNSFSFAVYIAHATPHATWVDEIVDVKISIKKINKS